MPRLINIYSSQMKPKQKKELLGIYMDYLYFEKSLEFILSNNSDNEPLYMIAPETESKNSASQGFPWSIKPTTAAEYEIYKKFIEGVATEDGKYSYISLYHIKEECDVSLPKAEYFYDKYTTNVIDLDLPCPVERYVAACVNNQKMKDAVLLIDGKFQVKYLGDKYKDMSVAEAFGNEEMQIKFRTLLRFADYYDNNNYRPEQEYTDTESNFRLKKLMTKITAAEILAEYENKILDLLGMYGSKAQEIIRELFPKKDIPEALKAAENAGLISSAETMRHYLNIRHLLRHRWDSLDGMGNFSPGNSKEHENVRKEYIKSYRLFFDKSLRERVEEYLKVAGQMQILLKEAYPNFLARKESEDNAEFIQRLKDWQKDNPEKLPMVNTNYPLASEKHTSLVSGISSVLPQTVILDDFNKEDCEKYKEKKEGYFRKGWYLSAYNHTETEMMTYCWTRGFNYNRNRTWEYFKKNVLSREEYDNWCRFRILRNNLSHNHLNDELRADLMTAVKECFGEYVGRMAAFLRKNIPQFTKQPDGTFLAVHNDGLRVVVDAEKMVVISCKNKDGTDLNNSENTGTENNGNSMPANTPIKVHWWEDKIVDCRLADGIYIDLKRQKVCFPDDTRICFDGEEHNYFRLGYNKLFTDKTFIVTKYSQRGIYQDIKRNEDRVIALGHRIRTDNKGRITEDIITLADGRKLNIKFKYDMGNAVMIFPDGTKLDASKGKFKVSHNGIDLTYANRHTFRKSYENNSVMPIFQKSPFER